MIGSLKTNIGHLEAAAGIAGLIKAVLSLQHAEIPPHLSFPHAEPEHPLGPTSPGRSSLSHALAAGRCDRAIAAVSSFGMSGANAHVVLEEAAQCDRCPRPSSGRFT